jgi:predicted SnoaL-like aldol condensation-catalyzing enzyme
MSAQDDQRKTAIEFLQLASSGNVHDAFRRVLPKFRHHNPHFAGDAMTLSHAMATNAKENPNKVFEVKRSIAEGDLVAVHSCVSLKPEAQDVAVVHIFRFEDGRIAELWDVGQPVPPDSSNEHGMF